MASIERNNRSRYNFFGNNQMDTIDRLSENIAITSLGHISKASNRFLDDVDSKLLDLSSERHRIKLLNNLIGIVKEENSKHKEKCPTDENQCQVSMHYNDMIFYLKERLSEYGIISDDEFSADDKFEYVERLDRIIDSLDGVLAGQQLLYAQILEEIDELKKLMFLTKKSWKNLFTGTVIDWVGGGLTGQIVSENILPHMESIIKFSESLKLE